MAIHQLEKLGIEPIEYLNEVYKESLHSYRSLRGLTDKSDSGPYYLAQALGAAKALASYKYPTLSAIGIKDMSELDPAKNKPMNSKEAIELIKKDPFAPPEIKALDINEHQNRLVGPLPIGQGNKKDGE